MFTKAQVFVLTLTGLLVGAGLAFAGALIKHGALFGLGLTIATASATFAFPAYKEVKSGD